MTDPTRVPVIVAVGEVTDRPAAFDQAREPVALMADAIRAAEQDAGVPMLAAIGSVELVASVTWRYRDPVAMLCDRLGVAPARRVNASMGGETPVRLVHDAALRITRGEGGVAVVVGGEAVNALGKARKAGVPLPWTPPAPGDETVRVEFAWLPLSPSGRRLGITDPVHIYPLYESALQAARGLTPAQGRTESAALWARYAAVAADNPYAWLRTAPSAETIATPSADNRPIAFPYTKLMVANPSVNQAGAVVVASLAWARAAGIADERLVHLWGGAAAEEPGDFLLRDRYDHSTAQAAVLKAATAVAGGDAARFDLAELYSCFPVVPKLAAATLALRPEVAPTVAGGLTFFGGPLNNYMTHAIAAMVRRLRDGAGALGLAYGQGGVVSKHHALVLGREPPPTPLADSYSVQADADAARGAVPRLIEDYTGPARIETYTVVYAPDGEPRHGAVVLRAPGGERLIARADDDGSLGLLTDESRNAIGTDGQVRVDASGAMIWRR